MCAVYLLHDYVVLFTDADDHEKTGGDSCRGPVDREWQSFVGPMKAEGDWQEMQELFSLISTDDSDQSKIAPPVTEGPIEHLLACHRRIEARLATLDRAGHHFEDQPRESLLAISNSLRFMDTSGVLHTVDEEQSVFPRLRSFLTTEEVRYLDDLESQHREVDSLYDSLKRRYCSFSDGVPRSASRHIANWLRDSRPLTTLTSPQEFPRS